MAEISIYFGATPVLQNAIYGHFNALLKRVSSREQISHLTEVLHFRTLSRYERSQIGIPSCLGLRETDVAPMPEFYIPGSVMFTLNNPVNQPEIYHFTCWRTSPAEITSAGFAGFHTNGIFEVTCEDRPTLRAWAEPLIAGTVSVSENRVAGAAHGIWMGKKF